MPRNVKPLKTPSQQYVDLPPWNFVLWWTIILAVHLIMFGYNTAYAVFYYELHSTYMYQTFEYFGIGMAAKDHYVIADVNAVMAALHGVCVLLMIGGSIRLRELAFSPWRLDDGSTTRRGSSKKADPINADDKTASRLSSVKLNSLRMYSQVWGRRGVLGVNGSNFHAILIIREIIETGFQTHQAYRMSWYLPRLLLNRFYLILLVLNCWSSVLVYSILFKKNEARRRFACLLCDCILDLVSCLGIPLIVVLSYAGQYNKNITGFDMERWYDDEWSAHVVNEFQMVLVTSWSDLISQTVFSLGVISTTTSLKELLRRVPSGSKRRIACAADSVRIPDKPRRTEPNGPTLDGIIGAYQQDRPVNVGTGKYAETGVKSHGGRMLRHFVHLLFGAWGVVVLGLHIQASLQPGLPQCTLQVHPWAVTEPACYLAVLDCNRLNISGRMNEVEAKWSEFDGSSVVTLVVHHCPAMEVPNMLGEFYQLRGIKMYNSTIASWGMSAAITNTNHPDLGYVFLVRVNMTDGVLPAGFLSHDFPSKLYDIEFCYTNLRELPDNLDSTWMIGTMIYIEYSQLTTVPLALTRLNPYYLALTGNPITELPPEVFEVADMLYLGVGSTLISELPQNVTNLSPLLSFIYTTNTNVSFFWPWIDSLVQRKLNSPSPLLMGGSTYCSDLDNIMRGKTSSFRVLSSAKYSSTLMDPTEANRPVILHTVNCDVQYGAPFYPIDLEDFNSALK
ncbi:unnamed protein product [Phytophthora fragariaefolia]|uniref:Unnamed protein product n=1 Tax=Phytophthora fragariaefolia TaxID=1490495 RepID=A0A9W6XS88_9STRA|nr:unnamed protein product [Phytophthora fragariaefolia]